MTTNQPLSLFISSKMDELAEERHAIQTALKAYHMFGWLWEDDAGARPEPTRSTYLKEVEACDLYLGLFWLGYGRYTIEEYQHARQHQKPCLVYEKHVEIEQRHSELAAFLQDIGRVENPVGLTIRRFQTAEELAKYVQEDVLRLLTTVFRKSRQQPPAPQVWNVPYRRNLFFTGRETLLTDLHTRLSTNKAAALTQAQAISGLGGIGKTQIALEYAYRYKEDYQAIFWVRVASRENIVTDFTEIARHLALPEKDEPDQNLVIATIRRWLTVNSNWLLILDNAGKPEIVAEFLLPSTSGHILMTTRAQAIGNLAEAIEVEKMARQEGIELLLRRAKMLKQDMPLNQISPHDHLTAQQIVEAMDGLPLALDQAGAYIEEIGCGLADYLSLYTTSRKALLKRKSKFADHPDVATTFTLAFQKVKEISPTAANLLCFFAFLDPDAIPEELITQGASELGTDLQTVARNPITFQEMLGVLHNFSLIRRNAETATIAIHRLVQAVIKDEMDKRTHHRWAERTVKAVSKVFPDIEVANWPQCEHYVPHALMSLVLIEQYRMAFLKATELLYLIGAYFY